MKERDEESFVDARSVCHSHAHCARKQTSATAAAAASAECRSSFLGLANHRRRVELILEERSITVSEKMKKFSQAVAAFVIPRLDS